MSYIYTATITVNLYSTEAIHQRNLLYYIAKQKHLGCKKVRGQSEANRQAQPKGLISAEAKKLLYATP